MPTSEYVNRIFKHLATGESEEFFKQVADDVEWTVMGTHPLSGFYRDKQSFVQHTFARLNRVMVDRVKLRVDHIFTSGDMAVVEMTSHATAKNGKPFRNRYCWVVRFHQDMIVEVRAYLDSALVAQVLAENERAAA